jgi:hypothetical protein
MKRYESGKKKRGTQLTAFEVLAYPGTISEPTPYYDVSIIPIISFPLKITSFQKRDSKRMLHIF